MTWVPTDEAVQAAILAQHFRLHAGVVRDILAAALAVDAPKIAQAERERIVEWLREIGHLSLSEEVESLPPCPEAS